MTRSHWRFATSVGLLAVGLMANAGGAVAVADPGSEAGAGAATGADGAAPTNGSTNQTSPLGGLSKTLRATIEGTANALNPRHLPRPRATAGSTESPNTSLISTVPPTMADPTLIYAPATEVSAPPQSPTTPVDDPVAPSPIVVASESVPALGNGSNAVTSLTTALASTTDQVAQATNTVVVPATAAMVAGVQSVVAPVTDGLANVTAPLSDVMSSLQALLTSTANAVAPVTQLPADLAALLGFAGAQPVSGQVDAGAHRPSTVLPPTPLQTMQTLAGEPGMASTVNDNLAEPTRPTVTAMSGATSAIAQVSSLNASARVSPGAAMPEGLKAFFHSYGAIVIAASLSALFAAALPGIIAFLIPTAAGMGVGYRQAKAGIALRAPDLARFAGRGPIGIVRSGSLVSLRPSTLRAERPVRTDAKRHLHLAA